MTSTNHLANDGTYPSDSENFPAVLSSNPRSNGGRLAAILIGSLLSAGVAQAAIPSGNLLVNGSGDAPMSTGWTVLENAGNGWTSNATGGYDATPGFFITSYDWNRRSQVVDLIALGATAAELDSNPPTVVVSEAISCNYQNGRPDSYYIRVELRDASNNVLASWDAGTKAVPRSSVGTWVLEQGELNNYGPGLRYIYFEDGGYDVGYWAGFYGTYHDAASVTLVPDPDGDGMPTSWEIANGTDPNVNDAAEDPDHDGLTNLEEYHLGTKPMVSDTDGDGLLDGVEDRVGTWASENATGTDPLNPDTDGDGLLDGVENPDLPFVDASQTGTNPHQQDSDGDGLPDLAEITHGSNPTDAASVAVFSFPTTLLADNFDGAAVNSTYAFTQSSGSFAPGLAASGLLTNGNVVRITNLSGSINNSIAWDAVPSLAEAVRITFDFRMSADSGGEAADGFGIGLFKTSSYGTTGPSNPGFSTIGEVNWENPTTSIGFPGALFVGFDIYGGPTDGNTVRVCGPMTPRPAAAIGVPPFQLNEGVFHRATITAIRNGASATAVSVDITRDVNGPNPLTHQLARGVVVKGFDISADAFRLIAGGRTGGSTVVTELDNLAITSGGMLIPAPVILSCAFNRTITPPEFSLTWTSEPGQDYRVESSTDLGMTGWKIVRETVAAGGTSTTLSIPVPAGSANKNFYRVSRKQ